MTSNQTGDRGASWHPRLVTPASCALLLLLTTAALAVEDEGPSFQREVLPLLSDRCFHCHGPDETHREADLRFDLREEATADRGGYAAIVPGDAEASEAYQRIVSDDEYMVMPPADSHHEALTKEEAETIRRWIDAGAKWGKHWAFDPPKRPEVPGTAAHPIDAFVRRRLEAEGIKPAERAESHTLARRLAFDLTGLPPTTEQADKLSDDDSPAAYKALADELLASPRYGERMAMWWLDAARYSDTDGFQQDETRDNWPWRDWVIKAFNTNKRFDRFTIEQFAGDLLPDATTEQKMATCFHRNHQTNGEGGRLAEESRVDYVIDRVNTVGAVWLGLTLGCAQCHSHKFDPISHEEYYQFTAFFNSIDETGSAGRKATPYLDYQSPHSQEVYEKAARLAKARSEAEREQASLAEPAFREWVEQQIGEDHSDHESWQAVQAVRLTTANGAELTQRDDASIVASGKNPDSEFYTVVAESPATRVTALRLEVLPDPSSTEGRLSRGETGEFVLTTFKLQVRDAERAQLTDVDIARAAADLEEAADDEKYGKINGVLHDDPRNGWTVSVEGSGEPRTAIFYFDEPLNLADGQQLVANLGHASTYKGATITRFRLSVTSVPAEVLKPAQPTPLERLAAADVDSADELPDDLVKDLRRQFLATHGPYQDAHRAAEMARLQERNLKPLVDPVQVMVLAEREKPRKTYILERGVWDAHGAEVVPGVPAAVVDSPDRKVDSRLDLAEWIVSPENPLTSRVIVNQVWQLFFGEGLVRTPDDFGLQGELPTHPDLLDWLAVEFVESGWDVKHLVRLIVTSETYQQSSDIRPELLDRDPKNELLARGARFRLPSWMIRDAAFAYSGLLDDSLGGPPVYPYQPDGVWDALFKGKFTYDTSQGPLQFRRTVYAFWRRSLAPTFLFDTASRRICEVRPRLTNTPLHALSLMNDLGQLEASRALAVELVESESTQEERIDALFNRVVLRSPTDEEKSLLTKKLNNWIDYYERSPEEAERLVAFGQPELHPQDNVPQTAAYSVLSSLVLNLDEVITHE